MKQLLIKPAKLKARSLANIYTHDITYNVFVSDIHEELVKYSHACSLKVRGDSTLRIAQKYHKHVIFVRA